MDGGPQPGHHQRDRDGMDQGPLQIGQHAPAAVDQRRPDERQDEVVQGDRSARRHQRPQVDHGGDGGERDEVEHVAVDLPCVAGQCRGHQHHLAHESQRERNPPDLRIQSADAPRQDHQRQRCPDQQWRQLAVESARPDNGQHGCREAHKEVIDRAVAAYQKHVFRHLHHM